MLCFWIMRNSSIPGQMKRALFCLGGGGGMWGRGGSVGSGNPICDHKQISVDYLINERGNYIAFCLEYMSLLN